MGKQSGRQHQHPRLGAPRKQRPKHSQKPAPPGSREIGADLCVRREKEEQGGQEISTLGDPGHGLDSKRMNREQQCREAGDPIRAGRRMAR